MQQKNQAILKAATLDKFPDLFTYLGDMQERSASKIKNMEYNQEQLSQERKALAKSQQSDTQNLRRNIE